MFNFFGKINDFMEEDQWEVLPYGSEIPEMVSKCCLILVMLYKNFCVFDNFRASFIFFLSSLKQLKQ